VISDLAAPSVPVKNNRRRNLFILLGGLVVIVLLAIVFGRPHNDAITARVITVSYGRYQTKLPETGIVQRPQTQTLAALVSGNLGQIFVRPGQHVVAGQLLATISNPQLVDAAATAQQAYLSAQGRARTAASTNATLPTQNRSAVVQAEANVETARFTLNQAIQDERAGTQSGLGYGGTSAAQQRAAADSTVAQRATDLREAKRIADADQALFNQKAIARNTVDQDVAKLQQAQVAYDQAKRDRDETYAQITRQSPVLSDRVRADRDAVKQAEAALAAARASAGQDKSGDVAAANADAQKAYEDSRYANDQVARTRIVAPFAGVVQTIANETADTLRPLQPGDAVTAGQAIVTLAGESGFVVRTRVDEQDVANVQVGQLANVSGEDLGTAILRGHVAAVGAVAQKSDDPSNTARQIITTVSLDRTVPYLRDGMNVDVDIVTADRRRALVIPTDAVRREADGKPYVLTLINGRAKKRSIKISLSNDVAAIVTSGVKLGDRIIADRNVGITDGVAVQPSASSMPSASPKASASPSSPAPTPSPKG
jgi:RND family efflux transporter MFP subunit